MPTARSPRPCPARSARKSRVIGPALMLVAASGVCFGQPANPGRPQTQPGIPQPGQFVQPGNSLPAQTPAPAQTISSLPPGQTPWPAVTIEQALAQDTPVDAGYAARLLERIALLDLRLQTAPTLEDYRFAQRALTAAAMARQTDANLWRRVVEAAYNAGDAAGLEQATRQVVALDTSDTVAQLRLITMRLARLQTREERLAAYERLLGPAGDSLDPSVRSRLALDAAVLAREGGDNDAFARLLTRATTLDSSHKEAAALALAYYQASVPDDPVGRMQLLCNLLLADPLDPHVHLAMSAELAAHGAFGQAARFHNNARNIIGASDPQMAEQLDIRGLLLIWQLRGPEVVVEELNGRLAALRHEAAYNLATKQAQNLAIRDEERPENTRLSREYELIRMIAADAAGMRDVAQASSADLTASALEIVRFYQRPENQPMGEEGRQLSMRILEMWIETLVVRAWAAGDMEALAGDLRTTQEQVAQAMDTTEALAWFGLRSGQQSESIKYFEATQDQIYRSRLGLALCLEAEGRREEAAEIYKQIAREDPLSAQSAWTRSRLLFMTGQDLARTDEIGQVAALADGVPLVIDRMLIEAQEFMRLHVETPKPRLGPLECAQIDIVLANRSNIPLAVGSDRPIDARFLMSPEVRIGGTPVIGGVQPEVFDLDRRLRLKPGEQIVVSLWPDSGFTADFLDTQAASRTGFSWRAIQGFRIVDQAYVRGPLCLSDITQEAHREPLLLARLSSEDLAAAIGQATDDKLPALARACWAACMSDTYGRSISATQAAALADAMAARYSAATPEMRALLLAMLPTAPLAPGFAAFDDALRASIASESDPTVLMLALVTRAATSDDPILAACRASQAPGLAEMADIQATRLDHPDDPDVYATAGPGTAALLGPALPSLRGVAE